MSYASDLAAHEEEVVGLLAGLWAVLMQTRLDNPERLARLQRDIKALVADLKTTRAQMARRGDPMKAPPAILFLDFAAPEERPSLPLDAYRAPDA